MSELHATIMGTAVLGVDNNASITISEQRGVTKLTKHFDFAAHRIRDEVEHNTDEANDDKELPDLTVAHHDVPDAIRAFAAGECVVASAREGVGGRSLDRLLATVVHRGAVHLALGVVEESFLPGIRREERKLRRALHLDGKAAVHSLPEERVDRGHPPLIYSWLYITGGGLFCTFRWP